MKKLLSSVAILALITSGVSATAITATSNVEARTSVAIGTNDAVATTAVTDETAEFVGAANLVVATAITLNAPNTAETTTFPVKVSTNVRGSVTMKITPQDMKLTADTSVILPTAYKYTPAAGTSTGGVAVAAYSDAAQTFTILSGRISSSTNEIVGSLDMELTPGANQTAGAYTEVIDVVIVATI